MKGTGTSASTVPPLDKPRPSYRNTRSGVRSVVLLERTTAPRRVARCLANEHVSFVLPGCEFCMSVAFLRWLAKSMSDDNLF